MLLIFAMLACEPSVCITVAADIDRPVFVMVDGAPVAFGDTRQPVEICVADGENVAIVEYVPSEFIP
jgi:hypothetical protein